MGLVQRHLSRHKTTLLFDPSALGERLRESCPEVIFALLIGSAREGSVAPGSDVDLAIYVKGRPALGLYGRIEDAVCGVVPGAFCDVGWLHGAEPVYRFEALKGRLLFTRNTALYVSFFSLTCRQYEEQLADYERQYSYRMGAA